MQPIADIQHLITTAVELIYAHRLDPESLVINQTRPEYQGQYTLVTFPLAKQLRKNPEEMGNAIGTHLTSNGSLISSFQVVKGFLNLSLSDTY